MKEKLNHKSVLSTVDRDSVVLDSEVTDVLFHFDAIMDSLEVDEPSPRTQSPNQEPTEVTTIPNPTPESGPPSPCDVESPELTKLCPPSPTTARNLPKVKEIQKQLLVRRDSDITQSKPRDKSPPRVNVQNIIQRLHVSTSPSPEPLPPSQPRPRSNSKSIQDKITVLTTAQADEPEDTRRSYTPPLVRRKIKSPFLERSKSEDFESSLSEIAEQGHPLEVISQTPSPLPPEDIATVTVHELAEGSSDIATKPPTVLDSTTREPVAETTEDLSETATVSDDAVFKPSPVKHPQTVSTSEKLDTIESQTKPHKSPDKVSVQAKEDSPQTRGSVNSESDREGTLEGKKVDSVRQDVPERTSETSHSVEQEEGSDRKRSAIIGPEDVQLTLEPEPTIEEQSESTLNTSTNSTHVELIIGVRENGLFEAPPRIVDPCTKASLEPPSTIQKSGHYDHLSSLSPYDHLPPLEPEETELDTSMFRKRSASDVISHRVHPVAGPPVDSSLISSAVSLWRTVTCTSACIEVHFVLHVCQQNEVTVPGRNDNQKMTQS